MFQSGYTFTTGQMKTATHRLGNTGLDVSYIILYYNTLHIVKYYLLNWTRYRLDAVPNQTIFALNFGAHLSVVHCNNMYGCGIPTIVYSIRAKTTGKGYKDVNLGGACNSVHTAMYLYVKRSGEWFLFFV